MDADALSATEVPDTQSTVSEREHEQTPHDDVTEPEELAQFKWREEYEDDLRDMATKGTMSPEWPILANIIKSRLVYNTRAFLTSPPRNAQPAPESQRAPLLPATSIDSFAIDDVPLETLRSAPSVPSEQPSTPGGLIIPPFPPRQSSRGRHRLGPAQRPGEEGLDVDEDAVIGGRTLPGSMRPGEAWQAVKAVIKLLDEFPTAPPFTIQRLCELAWKPFAQHTSLGKYIRAVEKNLLVTSTYVPDEGDPAEPENGMIAGAFSAGAPNGSIRSRASSVSSAASSTSSQSAAPLFSPIPFLVERRVINPDGTPVTAPATIPGGQGEVDAHVAALEIDVGAARIGASDVSMDEGEGEGEGASAARPGTPMTGSFHADRSAETAAPPLNHLALATSSVAALASNGPTTNGIPAAEDAQPDAAHEPFTGRVDELDAGPLVHPTSSPTAADPHQLHLASSTDGGEPAQHQEGTGERGTMTPHAMADRPQAISSTTDLTAQRTMDPPPSQARTIRAMPRTSSVASSLNERFVAGETLEANVPGEEGAVVHEGMEEQAGSENPAKAVKLG